MIIFYSGEGTAASPELVLQNRANVMLTFHKFHKKGKPDSRFAKIIQARRKKDAKRPPV